MYRTLGDAGLPLKALQEAANLPMPAAPQRREIATTAETMLPWMMGAAALVLILATRGRG